MYRKFLSYGNTANRGGMWQKNIGRDGPLSQLKRLSSEFREAREARVDKTKYGRGRPE